MRDERDRSTVFVLHSLLARLRLSAGAAHKPSLVALGEPAVTSCIRCWTPTRNGVYCELCAEYLRWIGMLA